MDFEYTLMDYNPLTDGDEIEWGRAVDAQGWRTWHNTGVWIDLSGRRVRRWSLRRVRPPRAAGGSPPGPGPGTHGQY